MADVSDVLYRLRNMAGDPADELRAAIAKAQVVLDKLDALMHDFEDAAQLVASSDIEPSMHADPPKRSGLTRPALPGTDKENPA